MRSISSYLLLTLAATASFAVASPLSTLPLDTRAAIGRLTPPERRELASRIAVELFARVPQDGPPTEIDKTQLEHDVATFLADVRALKERELSAATVTTPDETSLDRRLFGFGDDDSNAQASYAPVKSSCPDGVQYIRTSSVSALGYLNVSTKPRRKEGGESEERGETSIETSTMRQWACAMLSASSA